MKRTILALTGTAVCMGCLALASCGTKTNAISPYEAYKKAFEITASYASDYTMKCTRYAYIKDAESGSKTYDEDGYFLTKVSGYQRDTYEYDATGKFLGFSSEYYADDFVYSYSAKKEDLSDLCGTYEEYYEGASKEYEKFRLEHEFKYGILYMNYFSTDYCYYSLMDEGNGVYKSETMSFQTDLILGDECFWDLEINIKNGRVTKLCYRSETSYYSEYELYDFGKTKTKKLDIAAADKASVSTDEAESVNE